VRTLSDDYGRGRARNRRALPAWDCAAFRKRRGPVFAQENPRFPYMKLLGDMAVSGPGTWRICLFLRTSGRGIGVGAFHEHVHRVFQASLHVRHTAKLDRFSFAGRASALAMVDDLRGGFRHGVVNSLPVHVDDELDTLRVVF